MTPWPLLPTLQGLQAPFSADDLQDFFRRLAELRRVGYAAGVQILFVAQPSVGGHPRVEALYDNFGGHALVAFAAHFTRRSCGRTLSSQHRRFKSAMLRSCKNGDPAKRIMEKRFAKIDPAKIDP